jgi:hypothetical protein
LAPFGKSLPSQAPIVFGVAARCNASCWPSAAYSRIFAFAWSRDGTMLPLARGAVASDVVLITSER